MSIKYKVIDPKSWNRYSPYKWFSTFSNPTYGFNVKIDVSSVVLFSKKTKTSFFINFMFLVNKALNEIESFRFRIVKDEIRLYEYIDPTWTVRVESLDTFDNARGKYFSDYKKYYEYNKEITENIKNSKKIKEGYNDGEDYSDYYITCIPWLSLESMTHPIPDNNLSSSSVPRICWDKYIVENNKYILTLNITVSHILVDGRNLSDAFNKIKEYSLNIEKTIKG